MKDDTLVYFGTSDGKSWWTTDLLYRHGHRRGSDGITAWPSNEAAAERRSSTWTIKTAQIVWKREDS